MIICGMKASFGKLQGEELVLHEGLNIIEAPNEAGKSTWSHFIRTMLYGISTSERSKNGSVPDKLRFRPWGGLPMQGSMDIIWHGKKITLTRSATGGDKPMGSCIATLTGTGEKIPELSGKNAGEILLGITEPVFRRSAFITASEIPVDKDAELEKKITSLVTSGEEDCSYTDADERLRRWQRKRRFRSDAGRLPEAEKRLREVRQALCGIEAESSRLADLREKIMKLNKQKELLELELRRHIRDERADLKNRLTAAENTYNEAKNRIEALDKEIAGATETDIRALEAENSKLEIHRKTYREAEEERKKAEQELKEVPRTAPEGPGRKGLAAVICYTLALVCFVVSAFFKKWFLCVPAGTLMVFGAVLTILRSRALIKLKTELASARELAEYRLKSAEERSESAKNELKNSEDALALHMKKLGAYSGESPEAASKRITEAIADFNKTSAEVRAAAGKAELLRGMCAGDVDNIEGETKLSKTDAENYLKQTVSELDRTIRELDRGEGAYSRLGDPLLLSTEEKRLTEEILTLEKEYRAFDLAIYAMKDASSKLQSLFSPIISREAGHLMSRMTSDSYRGVYFDREMRFSAARQEDVTARGLEYLSDGTKNQLYLSLRLALCRLALPKPPEGEPCFIILDGVLDSFDDSRAEQALKLLCELAEERQIILFTCHSREKRILKSMNTIYKEEL